MGDGEALLEVLLLLPLTVIVPPSPVSLPSIWVPLPFVSLLPFCRFGIVWVRAMS